MLSLQFIDWLAGYLDSGVFDQGMDEAQVGKVRDKLNSVFRHEIDPEQDAGRDAAALRRAHDGEPEYLPLFDPEQRDMC